MELLQFTDYLWEIIINKMKITELRKLVREEVENALNEGTYPITVAEVFVTDNRLIITIGNSSADFAGYRLSPENKKKIDAVMLNYTCKPIEVRAYGIGNILTYSCAGARISMNELIEMRKKIEALNIVHSY